MIKIMKENSAMTQIRHDEKKLLSRDLDETDMFFLSLAKTTKTLPPIEQTKVKLLVSQTVLQAQIAIGEQAFRSSSVSPVSYISTHSEASTTSSHFATSTASSFSQNREPTITFGNNFESQANSPPNLFDISGTQHF